MAWSSSCGNSWEGTYRVHRVKVFPGLFQYWREGWKLYLHRWWRFWWQKGSIRDVGSRATTRILRPERNGASHEDQYLPARALFPQGTSENTRAQETQVWIQWMSIFAQAYWMLATIKPVFAQDTVKQRGCSKLLQGYTSHTQTPALRLPCAQVDYKGKKTAQPWRKSHRFATLDFAAPL